MRRMFMIQRYPHLKTDCLYLVKLISGDHEKYKLLNYEWSKYNVHATSNVFLTKWLPKCAV